jgi:DDE superfamily endonuclease
MVDEKLLPSDHHLNEILQCNFSWLKFRAVQIGLQFPLSVFLNLFEFSPCLRCLCFGVWLSGMYGSEHDARAFVTMPFVQAQLDPDISRHPIPPGYWIAGDPAFSLSSWCLTPYDVEPDKDTEDFDAAFSGERFCIERVHGKMKCQWRQTLKPSYDDETTRAITAAAVVLHDMTVDDRELYDWEEKNLDVQSPHLDTLHFSNFDDGQLACPISTPASRAAGRQLRDQTKALFLLNRHREPI